VLTPAERAAQNGHGANGSANGAHPAGSPVGDVGAPVQR
jgi:hypothetical protein